MGVFHYLYSFIRTVEFERFTSEHNPLVRVVMVRGKTILDAKTVNYSFGELHEVLRDAFDKLQFRNESLQSVLLLGFGGGSAVRLLKTKLAPSGTFTAVEIDPKMITIAKKYFPEANDTRLRFICKDAAEFVESNAEYYNLIVADIFVDEETPEHVKTKEFLTNCANRLRPRGIFIYNCLANTVPRQGKSLRFQEIFKNALPGARQIACRGNVILIFEKSGGL